MKSMSKAGKAFGVLALVFGGGGGDFGGGSGG